MLHVGAQGDAAFSLAYFKEKGLCIDSTDHDGSTPLHWACFAGSDTACFYLQSWGVKVNMQDSQGNTPLHVAVGYTHNFDDSRAIKELLIKGADRTIKNNDGQKPIDLVQDVQTDYDEEDRKNELMILLDKQPTHIPCFTLKQPLKKVVPSRKMLILSQTMLWTTFIGLIFFVFPYINADIWFPFVCLLFVSLQVFHTLTATTQPGYMQGSP